MDADLVPEHIFQCPADPGGEGRWSKVQEVVNADLVPEPVDADLVPEHAL